MIRCWMRQAYRNAILSPDPSTQNGAVLVTDDGQCISNGYTTFPAGVLHKAERLERPMKYSFMEHAERMTIFNAVRDGAPNIAGSTLYCLWASCDDCARAIIAAGIKEVVTHSFYDSHRGGINAKNWDELLLLSKEMFEEAGVKYTLVDIPVMDVGEMPLLFNGSLVTY